MNNLLLFVGVAAVVFFLTKKPEVAQVIRRQGNGGEFKPKPLVAKKAEPVKPPARPVTRSGARIFQHRTIV